MARATRPRFPRRAFLRAAAITPAAAILAGSTEALAADVSVLASVSDEPLEPHPVFTAGDDWTPYPAGTVSFTAPASGRVLVGVSAALRSGSGGAAFWRLVGPGGPVPGSEQLASYTTAIFRISSRVLIEGLPAGASVEWQLEFRSDSFSEPVRVYAGGAGPPLLASGSYGPLTMVVIAA